MFSHSVYFSLEDDSAARRDQLLASCREHLTDHDGLTFFGCGTLSDLERPVNDRDYDVALIMVFKDRAAHDSYQVHARHEKFRNECLDGVSRVRVFDADL